MNGITNRLFSYCGCFRQSGRFYAMAGGDVRFLRAYSREALVMATTPFTQRDRGLHPALADGLSGFRHDSYAQPYQRFFKSNCDTANAENVDLI